MDPNKKLLEAAAILTMKRIRRDRRKAPAQIKPLLEYLEEHLFDGDLDANRLKQACGVRDNTLPLQFHDSVGLPPYAYIEDCRMEVACRLLEGTDLKIWQIAQLIGYAALQTFSRAFKRWSGVRPSTYRANIRDGKPGDGLLSDTLDDGSSGSSSSLSILKAMTVELAPEEADELATYLAGLYPDSFASPPGNRDLGAMAQR